MYIILAIISIVVLTNALEPLTKIELGDDKIKDAISKYMQKIPDIEEQYVIDERISRAISHYFKGKISSFPLYKVSVKIDRNPIKIPWTLGEPKADQVKPLAVMKKNPVKNLKQNLKENLKDNPNENLKKNTQKQIKKRYKFTKNAKQDTKTTTVPTRKPVEKIEVTTTTLSPTTTYITPTINTTLA